MVAACNNFATLQRNYELQLNLSQQQLIVSQQQHQISHLTDIQEELQRTRTELATTQNDLQTTQSDLRKLQRTVTPLLRQQTRLALGQIVSQVNQLLARLSDIQIDDTAEIVDSVALLEEQKFNSPYFKEFTQIGVDNISKCLTILRRQRCEIAHPTILEDYTSEELKEHVQSYFQNNPYAGFSEALLKIIDWMYLVNEQVH